MSFWEDSRCHTSSPSRRDPLILLLPPEHRRVRPEGRRLQGAEPHVPRADGARLLGGARGVRLRGGAGGAEVVDDRQQLAAGGAERWVGCGCRPSLSSAGPRDPAYGGFRLRAAVRSPGLPGASSPRGEESQGPSPLGGWHGPALTCPCFPQPPTARWRRPRPQPCPPLPAASPRIRSRRRISPWSLPRKVPERGGFLVPSEDRELPALRGRQARTRGQLLPGPWLTTSSFILIHRIL